MIVWETLSAHSLTIPSDVLFRALDGEAFLLHLTSGTYFGLDDVGTRMWQLLTTAASLSVALDQLEAEYAVDRATLQHDATQFINTLISMQLLTLERLPSAESQS